MTIAIELSSDALAHLQAKAARDGKKPEAVAADVLSQALAWEMEDQAEAVEGIRRGLADFEAGRFRPLDEVLAEKQAKYGLPD